MNQTFGTSSLCTVMESIPSRWAITTASAICKSRMDGSVTVPLLNQESAVLDSIIETFMRNHSYTADQDGAASADLTAVLRTVRSFAFDTSSMWEGRMPFRGSDSLSQISMCVIQVDVVNSIFWLQTRLGENTFTIFRILRVLPFL